MATNVLARVTAAGELQVRPQAGSAEVATWRVPLSQLIGPSDDDIDTRADIRIRAHTGQTSDNGDFALTRIPSLPASQVGSGEFAVARIPNLSASKVTSGQFNADRIPNLSGSKITSGTVAGARLATATTSVQGAVIRADAAAVTAGTAGRVTDAAQLKAVADTVPVVTPGTLQEITGINTPDGSAVGKQIPFMGSFLRSSDVASNPTLRFTFTDGATAISAIAEVGGDIPASPTRYDEIVRVGGTVLSLFVWIEGGFVVWDLKNALGNNVSTTGIALTAFSFGRRATIAGVDIIPTPAIATRDISNLRNTANNSIVLPADYNTAGFKIVSVMFSANGQLGEKSFPIAHLVKGNYTPVRWHGSQTGGGWTLSTRTLSVGSATTTFLGVYLL